MMTKTLWKSMLFSGICLITCQEKSNPIDFKITQQKPDYGYQIIKNNKTYIDQPYIPAIPGEQVFKDSLQAQKTATLVVQKIENSSVPRISTDELDSMKIEYEISLKLKLK